MFTIWIEFDLGQHGLAFTTESKAKDWIDAAVRNNKDILEDYPNGFESLDTYGLCDINKLCIDPTYFPYN